MNNSLKTMIMTICLFSAGAVFAAPNYSYQQTVTQPVYNSGYVQQPLKGTVVMVPAGASINATLSTPLSSEYTSVGQSVNLALNDDFYYADRLVAPAGSTVYGTVIESSKAKRGGINGKLCVRFTRIYTPQGVQIPITAVIRTDDSTGVLKGGTKMDVTKEYAKDITAGSATGALSGLVFGALAGGDIGRGAALGTAVGAGGGLIKSAWDKGANVEIPSGAAIDIMLTQPITASPNSPFYEN